MKEVHYALVVHANFQKNSWARINNKKQNHALSVVHFEHITNNRVSPAKYNSILSTKFTNIQVLRILILWAIEHYDQCILNCSERFCLKAKLAVTRCLQLLWNTINQVPDTTESRQKSSEQAGFRIIIRLRFAFDWLLLTASWFNKITFARKLLTIHSIATFPRPLLSQARTRRRGSSRKTWTLPGKASHDGGAV